MSKLGIATDPHFWVRLYKDKGAIKSQSVTDNLLVKIYDQQLRTNDLLQKILEQTK